MICKNIIVCPCILADPSISVKESSDTRTLLTLSLYWPSCHTYILLAELNTSNTNVATPLAIPIVVASISDKSGRTNSADVGTNNSVVVPLTVTRPVMKFVVGLSNWKRAITSYPPLLRLLNRIGCRNSCYLHSL